MSIEGISAAGRLLATSLPSLPTTDHAPPTQAADGFKDKIVGAIEDLQGLHSTADALAVEAATGDLADVHEYTIAATQAELATQLTVAVRDRAVEAFNDIMRMQF
jgi:flagellar hook-basal body complex protein FliE